jgi:hypothetical protein
MEETERDKLPFTFRLSLWFIIYLVPQLFLIHLAPFFLLFPTGLIKFFDPGMPATSGPPIGWVAYVFYVSHLLVSLTVENKRLFMAMMVILLIAVGLNVKGCMESDPHLEEIKG